MPTTIQDCIDYVDAHIYDNFNEEVTAFEVNTALKMILDAMSTYIPRGEFRSNEAAKAAGLVVGETYVLTAENDYGIGARGVQITVY